MNYESRVRYYCAVLRNRLSALYDYQHNSRLWGDEAAVVIAERQIAVVTAELLVAYTQLTNRKKT